MGKQKPNIYNPVDAVHIAACLDASDDFAFEMRVLHVVSQMKLGVVTAQVEHGGTYIDPVTQSPRQFDIRLKFSKPRDHSERDCFLRLAVECKQLHQNAPLVISRSKRTKKESFHSSIRSRAGSMGPIFQVSKSDSSLSLYESGLPVGRSMTLVKADQQGVAGDSEVYSRWAQALASVDELIWEGVEDGSSPAVPVAHSTVLPCLVVPDDRLWTVDYDKFGNRSDPQKSNNCEYYVGKPSIFPKQPERFVISHLHVLTVSGFAKLLAEIAEEDFWSSHFSKD